MAILTYPLNGILYDAEDVETYLCTRTSGVFASDGHFPASVTGSREITIGPGLAWMQNEEFHGKAIYNPENEALTIAEADAYQTRIDRIVLQFDKLMNQTKLVVKQGTPASSPEPPEIERDTYIYELGLYTVNVKNSSISISESDVASTMLDESVCGIMEDAVTSIPTQELYDQWYAWFADLQDDTETLENQFNIWFEQIREEAETYMNETKSDFEVWMNGTKVDFDTWFDSIQDTLDSDTAGKLTNLVNDAQDTADEALEQLATGMVRGFMTDEYDGGEYALLADDADDSHAITLSRNICDCGDMASASADMISDQFQSNYTYKEGDYCIYQDTLFVFTADKDAGAWDWSCVQATNIGTELSNAEAEIANLATELDSNSTYKAGDTQVVYFAGAGYLTNSRTQVSFTIYLPKNVSTPYCVFSNDSSFTLRQGGTSLSGMRANSITSTVNRGRNTIYVAAFFDTLSSLTNNDAIGVLMEAQTATFTDDASASPQSIPDDDDDGDTKTAPGPEIIDPDDDTGGDDNPDDTDDDIKTAPGPEIIEPDDDGDDEPDDDDTGTLEPGEIIPDDGEVE